MKRRKYEENGAPRPGGEVLTDQVTGLSVGWGAKERCLPYCLPCHSCSHLTSSITTWQRRLISKSGGIRAGDRHALMHDALCPDAGDIPRQISGIALPSSGGTAQNAVKSAVIKPIHCELMFFSLIMNVGSISVYIILIRSESS